MSGLDRLREVAEAAWGTDDAVHAWFEVSELETALEDIGVPSVDAPFVATFDPPTVLALLKVLENATVLVDEFDRARDPDAEMDWSVPLIDGPLRAAVGRLREVPS